MPACLAEFAGGVCGGGGHTRGEESSNQVHAWLGEAARVLKALKKNKSRVKPFEHAVEASEAPGYFELIKRPMSLDVVGRKLEAASYAGMYAD